MRHTFDRIFTSIKYRKFGLNDLTRPAIPIVFRRHTGMLIRQTGCL